ncbi:MAG: cell division protein FtsA [Bacillota bacterium]|nr:cell division protein FtsA [Bacillota bacterium]
MRERRAICGLDIGTAKVCAVIAEDRSGQGLDVVGVGVSPSGGVRRGIVVDLERTSRAVVEAVEKAERMAGVEVSSVYAGVAGVEAALVGSHGVVAVARPDQNHGEDVQRVLEAARVISIPSDREVMHILPRSSFYGCRGIKDPVGMSGIRLEVFVQIVTGAATTLQNVVKAIHRAGLQAAELVLQPLAAAEAVLTPEEKEAGCLLVDIGGGTTTVAVFYEGFLWHVGVIPVAGGHLTSDLAIGLRLSLSEAEEAKRRLGAAREERKAGSASSSPLRVKGGEWTAERIIQARLEEIFELVRREADKALHPIYRPTCAVLTGGTALLPQIEQVAAEVLGLPVRIGVPTGVGGLVETVATPEYAAAVGLALWGRGAISSAERSSSHEGRKKRGLWGRLQSWLEEFFA